MKIIKIFVLIVCFLMPSKYSFSEENDVFDGKGGKEDYSYLKIKNNNFDKGKSAFKQALKYERKGKIDRAKERFNDSINYFLIAYKEMPDSSEILYHLGFAYNIVDDLMMSEIYYQEGLAHDPKNKLINQKLGELYFKTKRIDLAKKRLNVLSDCNCQEFLDLKNIIEKKIKD